MYRHVYIEKLISMKYYTDVPIDFFKRFSLPANDALVRKGDLYKLIYLSVKNKGLLDPFFCYVLVDVDLDNPPIYKGRKLYGALLTRGNLRWLVCKDLGINNVNAIVVEASHGQKSSNLFKGTCFTYSSLKNLCNEEDINSCYQGYNPNSSIKKNHIDLKIPNLGSVSKFGVPSSKNLELLKSFKYSIQDIDYVKNQLNIEKI